jgi:coiled-coil domain-containing protein 55
MTGFGLRVPEKKTRPKNTGLFTEEEEKSVAAKKEPIKPKIEPLQQDALEEDPSAFEYDSVYDSVSSSAKNQARLASAPTEGPRYMPAIFKAAEERKREQELVKVRKYRYEAPPETGEHVFMTAGYKRKLAEMKERGLDPDKQDPTDEIEEDSRDMSKFYSSLMKKNINMRERSPEGGTKK